jgi:hypothetical protein
LPSQLCIISRFELSRASFRYSRGTRGKCWACQPIWARLVEFFHTRLKAMAGVLEWGVGLRFGRVRTLLLLELFLEICDFLGGGFLQIVI